MIRQAPFSGGGYTAWRLIQVNLGLPNQPEHKSPPNGMTDSLKGYTNAIRADGAEHDYRSVFQNLVLRRQYSSLKTERLSLYRLVSIQPYFLISSRNALLRGYASLYDVIRSCFAPISPMDSCTSPKAAIYAAHSP